MQLLLCWRSWPDISTGVGRLAADFRLPYTMVSPGQQRIFLRHSSADRLFSAATGCACFNLNDADAAGMAEMRFGEGAGQTGVVLLITIGTGLGTVLFTGGKLLPNTELGHLYLENGQKGELFASDAVRKAEGLGWKQWGKRFNRYLVTMEGLFWPDLVILGGGASKKFAKFQEQICIDA